MEISKKVIYLMRHGETEYNKLGIVQGSGVDTSLNEKGTAQATAFFEKYKNIEFKKVYITALQRTYQTAEKFIDSGIPYEIVPEFNEISWGDIEGKPVTEDRQKAYEKLLIRWNEGFTTETANNGQSPEELSKIQQKGIEKIIENQEESPILITMHGRAMRILLCQMMNLPLAKMDNFEHSNTCLYKLEYDYISKTFEIIEANNTDHMK